MMIPVSAQFEVESGCTHRCAHCYNSGINFSRKSSPTTDAVSEAVAKSGIFSLTITGRRASFIQRSTMENDGDSSKRGRRF